MSQEQTPVLLGAKEFRTDEELHRAVDRLIKKVEHSQGEPIRVSASYLARIDDDVHVEGKVDEVLGITAEQLAKSIEAKKKRMAALKKARREQEKKRKAKELLAKKRLAALKKARAARRANSKAAKAKKKK